MDTRRQIQSKHQDTRITKSIQLYYDAKNIEDIDQLELVLSEKEKAEAILNDREL